MTTASGNPTAGSATPIPGSLQSMNLGAVPLNQWAVMVNWSNSTDYKLPTCAPWVDLPAPAGTTESAASASAIPPAPIAVAPSPLVAEPSSAAARTSPTDTAPDAMAQVEMPPSDPQQLVQQRVLNQQAQSSLEAERSAQPMAGTTAADRSAEERAVAAKEAEADRERLEKERQESERAQAETQEKIRIEKERIAAEQAEQERSARERVSTEASRIEPQRTQTEQSQTQVHKEQVDREQVDKEQVDKEQQAREQQAREKAAAEKLAQEQFDKEQFDKEQAEQKRIEREQAEARRIQTVEQDQERSRLKPLAAKAPKADALPGKSSYDSPPSAVASNGRLLDEFADERPSRTKAPTTIVQTTQPGRPSIARAQALPGRSGATPSGPTETYLAKLERLVLELNMELIRRHESDQAVDPVEQLTQRIIELNLENMELKEMLQRAQSER